MERVVLCMKWGTLYGPDYVNVLFNASRRHLSAPFRFVCLTDDPSNLVEGVETFAIPEIGCTAEMWRHGAWPKLSVFSPNLYGLKGRALFIDMDTVICGDLERFFTHRSPFVGIGVGADWRPGKTTRGSGTSLGTGVFAFDLGGQTQILENFQKDPQLAFADCGLEQVFVQRHASSVDYWPQNWVISFKRWLRRPIGLDLFLPPREPPPGTGMVAFHGDPRPIALLRPGHQRWDRWPRMGRGQVPWMRDYWARYGGTLPSTKENDA